MDLQSRLDPGTPAYRCQTFNVTGAPSGAVEAVEPTWTHVGHAAPWLCAHSVMSLVPHHQTAAATDSIVATFVLALDDRRLQPELL
jgi:hypothetical protein